MKAIISADELAKDVAGAESLLESHQEHKVATKMFPQKMSSLYFFVLCLVQFCESSIDCRYQNIIIF